MDAIVTKMEETLERKKSIANIVEKRTMVIDYIRRIHEAAYYGNSGFSNTPSLETNKNNNANGLSTSSSASSISSLNTSNSGNNLNKLYQQQQQNTDVQLSSSPPSSTNLASSPNNSNINNNNNINNSNSNNTSNNNTSNSNNNNNNSNNNNNTSNNNIGGLQQLFPNHNMHWMNVTMIQRQDFEKSVDIQKRLLGWFCLGFSLAPLIATDKGPAYIRSLVQLLEEYDYHFELGSAMQGVKVLLSKKQPTHTVVNENEHIKSKIVKIGTTVVYEFLKIFNISIAKDLDYFQVVFSLLEILEQIYRKIDKETCSSKYVYEALLKVDSRLKHNVFGFLSKEIDKMSMAIIKEQLDFTLLCTSIKDKDIQQHLNIQSKLANSLNTSTSGISKDQSGNSFE